MGSKNRQGCCCGGTPSPPYECDDYCRKYKINYTLTVVAPGFGTFAFPLVYSPIPTSILVADGSFITRSVDANWVANGSFGEKPFRFYWYCDNGQTLGGAVGRANTVAQLDNPFFIYGADWCGFGYTCTPLHFAYANWNIAGCQSSVGYSGLQTPATFYVDP